ncbi:MAG: hypothetical protein A3F46_11030 [Legionellales bacterium RIFCSPHIGHO2_12_FULL_42_9]|nr:MAG: hypothetical protein A3F46_11030 [Legionellales bacterium RIFCSPHIGHO2_12_FULL_42_9]
MSSLRTIFGLLLIIISFTSFAANQGIALIHGTNDHRQDADGNYWKRNFIDSLRGALANPENYSVVACDYSHFMWDEEAAGCTADQLLALIDTKKITDLTVYTHSNGANVIRWIVSNPTFDARYMRLSKAIKQVIAIAPSSSGTPLADEAFDGSYFNEGIGWLLGYRNDSVKQQRVGDMALYNDHILFGTKGRPSLSLPFRTVIGTDVAASPLSSSSYCNGYWYNTALKVTQTYLDYCSDGFLNCTSQTAAGDVWFFDIQKTTDRLTLSHNQSRHNCFNLDEILRQDLRKEGVA